MLPTSTFWVAAGDKMITQELTPAIRYLLALSRIVVNLPTRDLGKTDIHFTVMGDGEMLGKLEVSKGALVWYPSGTKIGHKMTWTDLNKEMQKYPKSEKRKKK